MVFGRPVVMSTEKEEDRDPRLYMKRAEMKLKSGDADQTLCEIDRAIHYSGGDAHYIYKKVKVLFKCKRYSECFSLAIGHRLDFKKDFATKKYERAIMYLILSGFRSGKIFTSMYFMGKYSSMAITLKQARWLAGFLAVFLILSKTGVFLDSELYDYKLGGMIFLDVGPGLLLGGIFGTAASVFNHLILYGWSDYSASIGILVAALTSFGAGGLSAIAETLCTSNAAKYILTAGTMYAGVLLAAFLNHGIRWLANNFHLFYSLEAVSGIILSSIAIFLAKKLKRDY
jgi:hypothetical protein